MAIRVGVIGLNHGAEVHLPAYRFHPRYEVIAVCCRTAAQAQAVAQHHGVPHWYTDPRDLIRSEVDLVSIASPPVTHAGLAAAAIAAGKHAVVEIGFACAADDARVLLDLSRDRGRFGAAAFAFRYAPALRLVSDLLAEGRIGAPRLMRFEFLSNYLAGPQERFRWIWDGDNGGGVLTNYVSHALDLAQRWLGPVEAVTASLATLGAAPALPEGINLADDSGTVNLHFAGGVLATFSYSAAVAYPRISMELHGSEGSLLVEGFGEEIAFLPLGGDAAEVLFLPEAYLEATRGRIGLPGGFTVLVDQLAGAITDGKLPAELPTFYDGWQVTRLVDTIKRAAREGRRVRLDEIP